MDKNNGLRFSCGACFIQGKNIIFAAVRWNGSVI
jgi:hypothetical protein